MPDPQLEADVESVEEQPGAAESFPSPTDERPEKGTTCFFKAERKADALFRL